MEARRAQGFLDSDVLVGSAAKAFRIIGNSVCRQVAFALGGKLAEAVKKGPVGSGNGKVVEEISLRREIEHESRIPPRHKVMVLITQKKRKDTPEDSTMRDDNVVRDIPSEDVGVDSMVGKGSDRVEVLVISSPRKRIRIEVDEEM
jgi:hypothetical protein